MADMDIPQKLTPQEQEAAFRKAPSTPVYNDKGTVIGTVGQCLPENKVKPAFCARLGL